MDRAYKQKIREIFQGENIQDVLTCSHAFEIATKYDIPLKDIGHYCNAHQIKLRGCQLGCFI
jgi:hypothetical protein